MDKSGTFQEEFVKNCCFRIDENLRMIELAVSKISEPQVWQKPNESLNSVGNLILHLCGNMTQYGIATLRGTEDNRKREQEFQTSGRYDKSQLLRLLDQTVAEVKATIQATSTQRFLETKKVQSFELSGIGNCIHLVEHFSYHTGQIAFWVKYLIDDQLGFYDGVNLNITNE